MKALLSLCLINAAAPFAVAAPAAKSFKWKDVKFIFSFGDSYTSTTFDPKGAQPNQANPLGNPVEFPGVGTTTSDGPNYIGFLTSTYNESFIKTYNIAVGGATVDNDVVPRANIPSVKQQVEDRFIPIYGSKPNIAPWEAGNTLFSIWVGINDVSTLSQGQNSTLIDRDFESYSNVVEKLWSSGARNFLFQNVPPIDRAPVVTGARKEEAAQVLKTIKDWNNRVQKLVSNLKSKHSDANVFLHDAHKIFTNALNDPKSYPQTSAIKNTTAFCKAYASLLHQPDAFDPSCGVPVREYFWHDRIHPTWPIHNVTAESIVKLLNSS